MAQQIGCSIGVVELCIDGVHFGDVDRVKVGRVKLKEYLSVKSGGQKSGFELAHRYIKTRGACLTQGSTIPLIHDLTENNI